MRLSWLRIPRELIERRQWAVSTLLPHPVTGKPDKTPRNPHTGFPVDPTKPSEWVSFEEAANAGYAAIGFMFSEDDPFCVVDLDNKERRSDYDQVNSTILSGFNSYAERSVSGLGFHIVVTATLGVGRRRESVEVYDRWRYMIMTGDVVKPLPIEPAQSVIDDLISYMGTHDPIYSGDIPPSVPQSLSDDEIIAKALSASNGNKFRDLFFTIPNRANGDDWSQRDAALAQMLAFYTKNHEQLLRLFRRSSLYRTDKYPSVTKYEQDYLLGRTFKRALLAERAKEADIAAGKEMADKLIPKAEKKVKPTAHKVEFPPGLIGEVAEFILANAFLPVREVALAGALSFVAGLAGREFNVDDLGLNLYLVLLAKSGRGKDAAASGIDRLVATIAQEAPSILDFIGPSGFGSGQALIKELAARPGFVSYLGEFGHLLRIITDPRASASDERFRQSLLSLYSMSGADRVYQPLAYSDREKNTQPIRAPAFSFMGDTTPEAFYSAFTQEHVAEGLLPRFVIVEYDGERVPDNKDRHHPPSQRLKDHILSLLLSVNNLRQQGKVQRVEVTLQAQALLDQFSAQVTERINSTDNDSIIGVWNRAALNVKRIAGLIAVGYNHITPQMTGEHVNVALEIVKRGMQQFEATIMSGEYGKEETDQLPMMVKLLKEFFELPLAARRKSYLQSDDYLKFPELIPFHFFNQRLRGLKAFKANGRIRDNIAQTIKEAEDLGFIQKVPPEQLATMGLKARADMKVWVLGTNFPLGVIKK